MYDVQCTLDRQDFIASIDQMHKRANYCLHFVLHLISVFSSSSEPIYILSEGPCSGIGWYIVLIEINDIALCVSGFCFSLSLFHLTCHFLLLLYAANLIHEQYFGWHTRLLSICLYVHVRVCVTHVFIIFVLSG